MWWEASRKPGSGSIFQRRNFEFENWKAQAPLVVAFRYFFFTEWTMWNVAPQHQQKFRQKKGFSLSLSLSARCLWRASIAAEGTLPETYRTSFQIAVELPANTTRISNHFRFIGRFNPEGGTILPSRPDIFGVTFLSYSYAAFFSSYIGVQARSLLECMADED